MSVLALLLTLAGIGFLAWLIVRFIPMPPGIGNLVYGVAFVIALLYALHAFGLLPVGNLKVPTVR